MHQADLEINFTYIFSKEGKGNVQNSRVQFHSLQKNKLTQTVDPPSQKSSTCFCPILMLFLSNLLPHYYWSASKFLAKLTSQLKPTVQHKMIQVRYTTHTNCILIHPNYTDLLWGQIFSWLPYITHHLQGQCASSCQRTYQKRKFI